MDIPATPSRASRVDSRHRRAQNIASAAQQQPGGAREDPSVETERERQRATMTKDHRFYHRRQAGAATKVLTVQVVATVDTSGNLVAQETKTQANPIIAPEASAVVNALDPVAAAAVSAVESGLKTVPPLPPALPALQSVPVPPQPSLPQVPTVPAAPTVVLPLVPSVPPFPSDLKVPPYPYASGSSVQVAQVSSTPVTPSPTPTSVLPSSALSSALPVSLSSILNSASNSTMTSTSSFLSSASRSSALASISSSSNSLSVGASSSVFALDYSTIPSMSGSATAFASAGGTSYYAGGGAPAGAPDRTAGAASQTSAAAGASASGATPPLQTPQVVGSVVGSLAGAALILAIILLLLQRHKRRQRGALELTNDEPTNQSPPMVQDMSRNNRIPSAFLNRFSGMSRSTVDTSTSAGERSFQRVSGRKLPSAFSEGLTSEQFARGDVNSGSSFYQDDHGTYGGPGFSKEMGKEFGSPPLVAGADTMNMRPGPARTPIIRHPEDDVNPFDDPAPLSKTYSHLSPPQSPNPDAPRSTLGRSLQSADGSRSSKFTENV